jgi:hypothetical protein
VKTTLKLVHYHRFQKPDPDFATFTVRQRPVSEEHQEQKLTTLERGPNGFMGSSFARRVLQALSKSKQPLNPSEISEQGNVDQGSVPLFL